MTDDDRRAWLRDFDGYDDDEGFLETRNPRRLWPWLFAALAVLWLAT